MRRIMKCSARKLRSNAGESIGETLVALLISALALVMLAGAISATARMINTSDKQLGKYYDGDEALVKQNSPEENTLTVTIEDTGDSGTMETHMNIRWYNNDAFANKPVVAYKKPTT